jgi:hypothetical protein
MNHFPLPDKLTLVCKDMPNQGERIIRVQSPKFMLYARTLWNAILLRNTSKNSALSLTVEWNSCSMLVHFEMPFYYGILPKTQPFLSLWNDIEPKRWKEHFGSLGPESLLERNCHIAWNSRAVESQIRPANSCFLLTRGLNVDIKK